MYSISISSNNDANSSDSSIEGLPVVEVVVEQVLVSISNDVSIGIVSTVVLVLVVVTIAVVVKEW